MEIDWYFKIALLTGLLILSAFFSGSEIALFSLDKNKVNEIKIKNPLLGGYIFNLLEFPRRLLVTILLCNTVINVAITIISVTLALDIARTYGFNEELALTIQIVSITLLILFIGEITPKIWASKYPLTFSKMVSIPLYWIGVVVYPVSKTLTDIIRVLVSKIKVDKSKTAILSSEFTELADLGIEKGTIVEEEQELIHGLVSFRTVTVREVMTPRVDITAIPDDTGFDELMSTISESGHSRIPLYHSNLDEVIGIIYAKDLLPYLKNDEMKKTLSLNKLARKALFFPETKLISDLMHEFLEKKMHIGIVVDEYGGTAGLISLEDILEEIVGDIRDEYDKEENEITELSQNSYLVLGKTSIDQINELLHIDLYSENDDYDTIGGFILNYAGTIPLQGYNFTYKNHKFTVKEIVNRRVKKVQIEVLTPIDIPNKDS
ncbi:MAG: HlyC/CorC family transporter [Ignavibacteria bacterium]|nr:HlyC/CorC family transporter [Ignavibacteria bacterium]MCU7499660.1 HlyC/CorC family transporter [Ignavibacteria bacterium]MCU7512899.1 HlyC/CorC family transporter [Ignavibacteria bacterium]MCU7521423.1 HlyC/CorC family transporter [Ignavibacteria bacterium]MCU7526396.1 HlyC/CorC family transporter [Ignavibacteria bacterium]